MDVFGIVGMTFSIIALGQIAKLRKEFEQLKKNLVDAGMGDEKTEIKQ